MPWTKTAVAWLSFTFIRGREGIQTPNLLIRSQMLYSVELRNHVLRLQIYSFSQNYNKLPRQLGFKP